MARNWHGDTYGSGWMHRTLVSLLRVVDVRLVYLFAVIFVAPFTLILSDVPVVYRYFRQRVGYGRLRSVWAVYQNHCQFSQVVIDRFAMYAGKRFDIHIHDYEHFDRLASRSDGFMQLSAHIGNYELSGYSLNCERKPVNALVFAGEKETVMASRKLMFGKHSITMIPIARDMGHLYAMNNALSAGEIVSFPADRVFGSEKTVSVNFLGGVAHLPAGPFRMAVMRGCRVLAINVMKSGLRKYDLFVKSLEWNRNQSRAQQVEELAVAYARQLEQMVRRYPTQWYNYFNFWEQ